MPDLIAKEPVEGFKLTREHKAFYKNYQRINEVHEMIRKGLRFQLGKVEALQQIAKDMEGQKKALLLRAPDQSVLDVEDEGMVEAASPQGGLAQGGLAL